MNDNCTVSLHFGIHREEQKNEGTQEVIRGEVREKVETQKSKQTKISK
jgi:uncharacterized protein YjbJ (UPF0337 family)